MEKLRAPPDRKNLTRKKSKKIENFNVPCGFRKCVFVKNGAFFSFSALGSPYRAVSTETTKPFSGQKKIGPEKNGKELKYLFFVVVSNMCLRRQQSEFRDFFSVSGPWCPLLGVRTEKT